MHPTIQSLRGQLRPMLALALPVVSAELGWMAMGVVDVIMVGRVSAEAIGGVGVGRAVFVTITVFGMGLLLGLDTVVSNAFGAGRQDDCNRYLIHGIYISVLVTVPGMLLLKWVAPLLRVWGVDPGVLDSTLPYLAAINWSLLPLLLYTTFRRYLQAVNLARPVMIALISANLVNVLFNWILIFGNLGAPALGAEGAGWASLASSIYMTLFLFGAIRIHDRETGGGMFRGTLTVELRRFRRLIGLGLPVALTLVLEIGVFALGTTLAGLLEPHWLAAHQIALTMASVTYMVPLGVSSAAAVRVGQAMGRDDPAAAGRAGWMALIVGTGFMLVPVLAFLVVPRLLLRIFTTDPQVIAAGVSLLAVAAVFQLFDGLQVVATGALRGVGNTRTPLLWNLIGHWFFGLPVGYYLCFVAGWGAVGIWIGWLVGLTFIGVVLLRAWSRTVG